MDGEEKPMDHAESSAQTFPQPRLWLEALLCSLLLAVELYVLLYDISGKTTATGARPVIGQFVAGVNEVLNRPSGTITWHAPEPGSELRRQDALLTMSNASALVRFNDGTEMGIEPDSLVVLEKDTDNFQKIVVKLMQGSLAKKKSGGVPLTIDVADQLTGGSTRVEDQSGNSTFRLQTSAEGVSLQVDSGNVRLGEGENAKVVNASQEAVIRDGAVEVRELPMRFFDLAPDFGKRLARVNNDDDVFLTWNQIASKSPKSDDIEPRLVLSRHEDLSTPIEADIDDIENGAGKASLKLEEDGTYYWRLESPNGQAKSRIASFAMITRAPPKLATSDDLETIVGEKVFIRWDNAAFAKNVFVETSLSEDFSNPTRAPSNVGASEAELQFDKPQTLYWRVRADYGAGIGLSPPSETRKLEIKPKPLLKPPKTSKYRIRISQLLKMLKDTFLGSGVNKQGKTVTVELEWAKVTGARQYYLQIANDETFTRLLIDQKISNTAFAYKTPLTDSTQTIYYRVASVDKDGDVGPFTDSQEIELPASLAGEHLATSEEPPEKSYWRLDIALGAAQHSRTFKSEGKPLEASGSGMMPSVGLLEFRRVLGGDDEEPAYGVLNLGVSGIGEKAEPTSTNVRADEFPISLIRAWAMYEKNSWGLGVYASTSHKFSFVGRKVNVERAILMGLSGSLLTPQLLTARHWHWRVHLGVVGVGAIGADVNATARYMLWLGRALRVVDQSGLFIEAEALGRFMNIETSYGGAFKLGYSF